MFDCAIGRVFLFYNVWQETYDDMERKNLIDEFRQGMPSVQFIESECPEGALVIIDDGQLMVDRDTAQIYSVVARHRNVNVFLLAQSLFDSKNPHFRTVSLNSNYIVLFKNTRNSNSVRTLASQMGSADFKNVMESYELATRNKPYGYLLIDLHQQTDDRFRMRTNIFGENGKPPITYAIV